MKGLDELVNMLAKKAGEVGYKAAEERDKGISMNDFLNSQYVKDLKDQGLKLDFEEIAKIAYDNPKKTPRQVKGEVIAIGIDGYGKAKKKIMDGKK